MDLTPLKALPGAVQRNFEVLTRSIVSRRFGALGALRERRNQPGVEFYLKVERAGTLGDPGRVWGWSCKWFELNSANELTGGQRAQIEDSLDKAIKHVDGLTDFVLCLPYRPAKKELDWIYGLAGTGGQTVRLWAGEDFEEQLAGCDELRSAFFGELVFTPDSLAKAHERSVAPVRTRWVPPVHTSNSVEHLLDSALLRPQAFAPLAEHAEALAARVADLRAGLGDITDSDARESATAVADHLDRFVADLQAVVDAARQLRPVEAVERIAEQEPPVTTPRQLHELVLDLRRRRLPIALAATSLSAQVREIMRWLKEIHTAASAPLIAIVGGAGEGKTHLMAQVTSLMVQPSAGVFILGWRLRTGGSLDELAQRIPGLAVQRFEELLEAANSAGARTGVRIPIAIDGLNEAERPSEWRALLDELVPALDAYPHVLVLVTLREALAERAIPDQALTVDLEWQKNEVEKLLEAYFAYYLIEPGGAWLPMWLFRHPLLLRMYCEAANPAREHPAGVEALPRSLMGVFERYRDAVCMRLADDPARTHVPADQIKRRLARVALDLWTRGVRRIPSDDAQAMLDAEQVNWDESLFRRLIEEGVLLREESAGSDDTETGVTFDLFAGYLIADALLSRIAYNDLDERLADPELWRLLLGDESHPLGQDVAAALVALLPRRFGGQHLWRSAPDAHRSWTLAQELGAESKYLDDSTVDALADLLSDPARDPAPARPYPRLHAFDRLWETAAAPAHRLNANFLDRVLGEMSLPQRDLRWAEWARHRASDLLLHDLNELIELWSVNAHRSDADDLRAIAVAWLTSSTHNGLRELATQALQRYGRPEPGRLFDLAERLLDIDDPYIVERVVAAAFGAASAHQMPDPGGPFENALADWLSRLRDRYLSGSSTRTSHELLRCYIRAAFELAGTLHPSAVPAGIDPFTLSFGDVPPVPTLGEGDERETEVERTLGMDFENYVVGSSIEGRGNYDYDHDGFRRARAEVLARVWELGWRADAFGDIDHSIGGDHDRSGQDVTRIERYGKKYGWIAYYELIGRQTDRGEDRDRWVGADRNVSADCDPTFPNEPPVLPIALPHWAPADTVDERQWLASGTIEVPEQLWAPEELHGVPDWILAEGFLEHRGSGRRVFGFFRTLLLDAGALDQALAMIDQQEYPGNDFFPRLMSMTDVFAGEIPWSPRYRTPDDENDFPRALRRDWQDDGVVVGQLAVDLEPVERQRPAALSRAYAVPSYEFASQFSLRQLPGTLDLVGLDGVRASATFSIAAPWTGHALFLRRDLVTQYAAGRVAVQVAWGERSPAVDWRSAPDWVRNVHQAHKHVWREHRVYDATLRRTSSMA